MADGKGVVCVKERSQESTNPLNAIISQISSSIVITTSPPILPIEDPKDSLIIGNEDLITIPEKESDEFIKSSVENLVLIPSESEDTSRSDSECDLLSCDDFSPIKVSEGKSVTFSNPLFDLNDDFTSSDDESLSDEDVPEDNVKIYSNPLFEFDDEFISSDVNLFDEVLENTTNMDSYDSNLDEPDLLVTPLFDANKDECFDLGGDIDEIVAFNIPLDFKDGYYAQREIYFILRVCLVMILPLISPPPEEFLDHDPRNLSDMNDLKIMVKVFDPGIHDKKILQHMIAPDLEASRARGFIHLPLEL
uniref:Reverse transcriptase domain-containing protein n=1 Tax=Tanacetum cinerariifolium TaxID=118510 RepID=A0A6L2JD26_TANCI|nr:hypothetical protein [Tanacetum cinerariifolium]